MNKKQYDNNNIDSKMFNSSDVIKLISHIRELQGMDRPEDFENIMKLFHLRPCIYEGMKRIIKRMDSEKYEIWMQCLIYDEESRLTDINFFNYTTCSDYTGVSDCKIWEAGKIIGECLFAVSFPGCMTLRTIFGRVFKTKEHFESFLDYCIEKNSGLDVDEN